MNTQTPTTPTAGGTSGTGGTTAFFDRIRAYGIVRPDSGRWAAGVSSGIAQRYDLDPLLVRGLTIALAIAGIGVPLYGLAWLFLPHPDGRIHAEQVLRGVWTAGLVGSGLLTLTGLNDLGFGWGPGHSGWGLHGVPFGLVLVVGIVLFLRHRRSGGTWPSGWTSPAPAQPAGTTTPTATPATPAAEPSPATSTTTSDRPAWGEAPDSPVNPNAGLPEDHLGAQSVVQAPARPRPVVTDPHRPLHALTRATLGMAALLAAITVILDRYVVDLPGAVVPVAFAVALGVVASGIVVSGVIGRRSGGLAPMALLLAVLTVGAAVTSQWVGDRGVRTWRPVAAADYRVGLGDGRLDLTDPLLATDATAADPVRVSVHINAGRLLVVVPERTAVEIVGHVSAGGVLDQTSATAADGRDDGSFDGGPSRDLDVRVGSGAPVVTVDAQVGLGLVQVVRAGTKAATDAVNGQIR